MAAQDDMIIEPANADDYYTVYSDTNSTMNEDLDRVGSRPYIRLNRLLEDKMMREGEVVRMRCEVAASPLPIKFEWLKNNAPLERKKGRRWRVTTRDFWSRLKISALRVLDSGYYRCLASNAAGSVNTTAVLKVEPGPKRHKGDGSGPLLTVAAGGGSRLGSNEDQDIVLDGTDPELPMPGPTIVKGPYDGSHEFAGPGAMDSDPFVSELVVGRCLAYVGASCEEYLAGQRVLIETTDMEKLRDTERQIKAAMMFIKQSPDISAECADYSHQAACYHSYKICDPYGPPAARHAPTTLRLCARDCMALKKDVCPKEYALAEEHKLIGQKKLLPDCDRLQDDMTNHATGCIPILDEATETVMNPIHICYVGTGRSYRGGIATTESGEPCMEWSSANGQYSAARGYEELRGAGNYCRNPGGKRPRPWCYSGPKAREEYCGVKQCPKGTLAHLEKFETANRDAEVTEIGADRESGLPNRDSPTQATGSGDLIQWWSDLAPQWHYAIIGGASFVALFLLVLLIYLCCRCKKKTHHQTGGSGGPLKPAANGSVMTHYNVNNNYPRKLNGTPNSNHLFGGGMELSALLPPPPARTPPPPVFDDLPPEIAPEQLRFVEPLGEGQFGKVWKGEMAPGCESDEPLQVAVKTLKDEALPRQKKDFDQEAELMSRLRHPNVLELIGIVPHRCMVFEYMIHGDLHEFLLLRSPYGQEGLVDTDRVRLDHNDFLHISVQIASGMEYLAKCHYVHRDLATRNCLVTDRLTIKVSDFGLMRDVYASDYYRIQSKTLLPIRWMPSEAILYGKFSEESDVWAYGVTLWEIYSYGTQPYYGYSNAEVIDLVRTRCLPECPDNCPSRMYSLMVECWHEAPGRRPRFAELHARLQTWSMMSSPAQSVAGQGHGVPHQVPAHPRSNSVHSGTSVGRVSRQSSSTTHHSNAGQHNNSSNSAPGLHTMVTMNGVVPFCSPALQYQLAKGSPGQNSIRGRPTMGSQSQNHFHQNHNLVTNCDLDSSSAS